MNTLKNQATNRDECVCVCLGPHLLCLRTCILVLLLLSFLPPPSTVQLLNSGNWSFNHAVILHFSLIFFFESQFTFSHHRHHTSLTPSVATKWLLQVTVGLFHCVCTDGIFVFGDNFSKKRNKIIFQKCLVIYSVDADNVEQVPQSAKRN